MTSPTIFLREAIKAVPAVKYALGVGGIVAAVAIVYSFQIDPRVAFVGTLITFLLMGILVVFARMTAISGTRMHIPALAFTWFVLLIFMATSGSLFSSVFFQRPLDLSCWLTGSACADVPPPRPPAPEETPRIEESTKEEISTAVNITRCVNDLEWETEVLHTSSSGANGGVAGASEDSEIRGPRSCGGNGWERSHYDVTKKTKNGDCSVRWASSDIKDCRYIIHTGIGAFQGSVDCIANVYRKRVKPGQPPLCQ